MNMNTRISKMLMIVASFVCTFMFSVIFFSPSAHAQSTCVSHANGLRQKGLPAYMTLLTAQGASAITDNVGNDVDHDIDVIRYEYDLEVDAALASKLSTAAEVCLLFTTSSKVKHSGHGLSEYTATLDIQHQSVNAASYQTFFQHTDARSTAAGDDGVETIQYAISFDLAGITLVEGDWIKVEIDGLSLADSRLGPPENYANANLNWLIGSAQIFQPRLVTY